MATLDNIRKPLSEFLLEYVDAYRLDRAVLPDNYIKASIKLLIDEGVFTEDELREELFKSKGIIVPISDIIGR